MKDAQIDSKTINMDQPLLSDEERRLLREYRITKVPTRRNQNGKQPASTNSHASQQPQSQHESQSFSQSCSSASSSSSSGSSTPSVGSLSMIVERQQTPSKTGSQPSPKLQGPQQHTKQKQTHSQLPKQANQDKQLHVPLRKSKSQSPQLYSHCHIRQHHHHHGQKHHSHLSGHHQHHHHHHHHHHHNRKHKSTTPTHELTADELIKMMDLASGLSYLKLVPPMRASNGLENTKLQPVVKTTSVSTGSAPRKSCNNNNNNKNLSKAKNGIPVDSGVVNDYNLDSESTNNENNNQNTFTRNLNINCNNNLGKLLDRIVEKPYIFEKVDYIKKISIRRKALKRLKKTKNKSCSVSPPTTTNSSTATEG